MALHALIVAVAWGVFSTLRTLPSPEPRIAVSLETYAPAVVAQPTGSAVPVAQVTQQTQPSKPIAAPKPPNQAPSIVPKPTAQSIAPKPAPAAVPSAAVPQPMPLTAPSPIRQEVKAAPPPPPEERYEEENLGRIRAILAERLKYPKNALRLKQQGEVHVTFTLSPSKEVGALVVTQSSGFELLDNAACDLITASAEAFPKPSKSVRITVPIGYKIR